MHCKHEQTEENVEQALPVHAHRDEIVRLAKEHQVIVVVGETGSGKTTVVPRFLLDAGFCTYGSIAVTEPRRIAAVSVAAYVAGLLGCELGSTVGYRIRHENRTDPELTKIAYMTEGVVLRELLTDPLLRRYDVLILDEVHERNLFQDLLMGLVKRLLPRRPDLKVVVMSATINERKFADYFAAPVVHVEGRTYPVAVEYLPGGEDDHVSAAVDAVKSALPRTPGDLLVFMPDYASIRDTMSRLQEETDGVDILPLYGNQSPEEQMAVFARKNRSVIVSTNVAETSVTLDGVTCVIDTGLIKEMRFFPRTTTSALKVVDHSKAGCDQRAGRAGRTAPGLCIRLYSERGFERRRAFTQPEILRSNLDNAFLQLRAMGFSEAQIRGIEFMDMPQGAFWANARETLTALGALDAEGEVTAEGRAMAAIPLPPVVSKMVLSAQRYDCVKPVITIAASFSTRPIFLRPLGKEEAADSAHRQFRNNDSDFLTLRNAVERWRASADRPAFAERNYLHQVALEEIEKTEAQLRAILEDCGIRCDSTGYSERVKMAVTCGLIANLLTNAGKEGNGRAYRKHRCEGVFIFPGSVVYEKRPPPKYIVAADIVETTRTYARQVQVVPARWLEEIFGIDTHRHRTPTRERHRSARRHRGRHG